MQWPGEGLRRGKKGEDSPDQKDIYELLRDMMKDVLQLLTNLLFWEEKLLS